jgi:Mor family transcriptional regulator
MIVIAYFHYETQRSDIEMFNDEENALKWLYDRWSYILDDDVDVKCPSTLRELKTLLYYKDVIVEMIEK